VTNRAAHISPLIHARVAGLMGFVLLVSGSFAGYVYTRLVVPGDAATTADNITAYESLFRLGIASGLIMYIGFIMYVWVLYPLLKPVNKNLALLMVILALIGVPIAMLNHINLSAALLLLDNADYLKAFTTDQNHAHMMFFLDLSKQGGLIGAIFWGLWLFPLGLLVFKSGCFPRILGVMLVIGCFGYLILCVQRFFFPDYAALAYSRYAAHIGELSWMFWLLIKGVNVEQWSKLALESA